MLLSVKRTFSKANNSQWWSCLVIPAPVRRGKRIRVQGILSYMDTLRIAWATWDPVSKNQTLIQSLLNGCYQLRQRSGLSFLTLSSTGNKPHRWLFKILFYTPNSTLTYWLSPGSSSLPTQWCLKIILLYTWHPQWSHVHTVSAHWAHTASTHSEHTQWAHTKWTHSELKHSEHSLSLSPPHTLSSHSEHTT